ncbi:aminopeptidase N [Agitococcus lubricus]|uniref:Aminopeptidase N n=1 Tax=Agitococcus lubricus TaxID=1077255 RepID=A0A2T5IZR9_9GAMM|nr:aminopeptidase N [Agitococcus lubricus]PTQ89558.1 aminopeptidase N [Agitococcus lubricus]
MSNPKTVYLKDYQAPLFSIEQVNLQVDIFNDYTLVTSTLNLTPQQANQALVLHGVDLELQTLHLDNQLLSTDDYQLQGEELVIHNVPNQPFSLQSVVKIYPAKNLALEGLYLSKGMYCTQCEPEGFRKISYYLDRPDVLSSFTTTITADKNQYPTLLANGNLIAQGDAGEGRHFATWQDPFKKPSYLFAMVAGDLACLEDSFTTMTGREVALKIYVEPHDLRQCHHAMESLKASMRWDEQVYGREYDLDIFMIVAVSHFNMGAMENKGLNIFNTSCVLAHPETTTDLGFQRVESVVAHEYFHNWSGNRVTCRDWFQLSLKEGFTVFRDQQFSADQLSASVQRIEDVAVLRNVQFAEDASPLAHPVRPESFIEINNFYTATVYEKGAEIVRMLHTVLGVDAFRKGTDLYFSRHDGQAVTVEDFVQALADANQQDLSAFMQWYRQPCTPVLSVNTDYNAQAKSYTLSISQQTPAKEGYPNPEYLPIPIKLALFDQHTGQAIALRLQGETQAVGKERVLIADKSQQTWTFVDVEQAVVPSLLRDFSAPVVLDYQSSNAELLFLMQHDNNGFNRWLAAQSLYERLLLAMIANIDQQQEPLTGLAMDELLTGLAAFLPTLAQQDAALAAKILSLPTENYLAEKVAVINPSHIAQAREALQQAIANALADFFRTQYMAFTQTSYIYNSAAIAQRSWRDQCLSYLLQSTASTEAQALAAQQYQQADNMSARMSALRGLVYSQAAQASSALADFYQRFVDEALVVDSWFAVQATNAKASLSDIEQLCAHSAFTLTNPNRLRSVVAQFANANPVLFHQADGAGYQFVANKIAELDKINPQIASRLLGAFSKWRRLENRRKQQAERVLTQLAQQVLSNDTFETLNRLLRA